MPLRAVLCPTCAGSRAVTLAFALALAVPARAGPWTKTTIVTRGSQWQSIPVVLAAGQALVMALIGTGARAFEARVDGVPARTFSGHGLIVAPLGGHASIRLVLGPGESSSSADLSVRAISGGRDVFDASTPESMRSLEHEILSSARADLERERTDLDRTAEMTGAYQTTAPRHTQLVNAVLLIDRRLAALARRP